MSDGTFFKPEIYLNRKIYRSRYELDGEIQDLEKDLQAIKEKFKMFAIATPKDIMQGEDILWAINTELSELWDALEEAMRDLTLIRLFKDHLEETGDDINNYYPYKDLI